MRYTLPKLILLSWLAVRVHVEALLREPAAYVTATKWQVLRKRMRARAQFAALLSGSPSAYRRWALLRDGRTPASRPGVPLIIALVKDLREGGDLAGTLVSLASESIHGHVVGPDAARDLERIANEIDWSARPWLLPITSGDLVSSGAAQAYRTAVASSDLPLIYADDDLTDDQGRRTNPHLKPDWNPPLFEHLDYLTGACILRAEREMLLGAGAAGADWDRAFVAQVVASAADVDHVRQVLHTRRSRPRARLPIAPLPIAPALPPVSVIIPTRNRADLLRTCINGVLATDYPALEIIVADNDSDEPATIAYLETLARQGITILPQPGPFNYSTINNAAVAVARGNIICLLNNDIEVLAPDWLAMMATQAMRADVGAVGAQLLYPDGRIQHAGVVIGVGNAAGHAHRFVRPEEEGYFHRHAFPHFVSAVTAACLVMQRERYLAVGGLDAENFAVAFNDVDLCLRLNARGWQSFYEPRAVLVHHESVSRGLDTDSVGAARFARELAALQRIWRTDSTVDPFHHPNLSRACEKYVLNLAS
jgi:GT2 family glycosyltransferase